MRALLIGTDRNLFTEGSAVHGRIARLAKRFPEDVFDFIVFSTHKNTTPRNVRVANNASAYATNSFSRLLYGWDTIRLALRLPKPDFIEAQDPFETGLVGLIAARLLRVPLLVQVHTDFLTPEFARHSFMNRMRVWVAHFVLPRAAGGYVVSERIRTEIASVFPHAPAFVVLPIFIDLKSFASIPHTPQKGALLWVGRFEKEKRPDVALYALARARTEGHDVHLTMLGSGNLEHELRELARKLGVAPHVRFPGWNTVADYLAHAELLLVTSAYEGFGMVVVEALAAGVPVLSTDAGIAREAGAVIASDDFGKALVVWLGGARARGTLSLELYQSEEEYLDRLREHFTVNP